MLISNLNLQRIEILDCLFVFHLKILIFRVCQQVLNFLRMTVINFKPYGTRQGNTMKVSQTIKNRMAMLKVFLEKTDHRENMELLLKLGHLKKYLFGFSRLGTHFRMLLTISKPSSPPSSAP